MGVEPISQAIVVWTSILPLLRWGRKTADYCFCTSAMLGLRNASTATALPKFWLSNQQSVSWYFLPKEPT